MSASGENGKATIDVVQLLNEKRLALNAARERYTSAKARRDEEAMSNSSRVIDSLKEIIAELEREAAVEVEAAGRKACRGEVAWDPARLRFHGRHLWR
ncbi:MAG: hypothetical protein ACXU96_08470 [Gemmatimonadaceae bacterium]